MCNQNMEYVQNGVWPIPQGNLVELYPQGPNPIDSSSRQVQVVHIDVNQMVSTILCGMERIFAHSNMLHNQQISEQAQYEPEPIRHLTSWASPQMGQAEHNINSCVYMAVYSFEGYGVFTNVEKMQELTKYFHGQFYCQNFGAQNEALEYARRGIAQLRQVTPEQIAENNRINWIEFIR